MKTIATSEIKSMGDFLIDECHETRYKKINFGISSNGVYYNAKKVSIYYWVERNEYIISVCTYEGYLIHDRLDLLHAQGEFSVLSNLEDEAEREGIPVTINFFTYRLYTRDMEEVIGADMEDFDFELALAV